MVLLLLLALPAVDWPWPADAAVWSAVAPARLVQKDVDQDGTPDELVELHSRGSGYRHWLTCVRHGESGERACVEFRASNYSHFRGYRVFAPAPGGPAARLLQREIPSCRGADVKDPRQGAMWMLHRETAAAKRLRWYRGRLKRQSPTCLSVALADQFVGGNAWHAQGDPGPDTPA